MDIVQETRILNSRAAFTGAPIGKQGRCVLTWVKPKCWGVWLLINIEQVSK